MKRSNLHLDGYEIIEGPKITEQLLNDIKKVGDKGAVIFNHNKKNKKNDKKRIQQFIKKTDSKTILQYQKKLHKQLKKEYPNLEPTDTVVLKSLPGCQRQLPHCDYEQDLQFATAPDSDVPLGCLSVLEKDTTLDVWIKSHRLAYLPNDLTEKVNPIKRQKIKLEPGTLLVFRGDLVHAGSSYENTNYRLHTYLDSDLVPRNKNRTWHMTNASFIL